MSWTRNTLELEWSHFPCLGWECIIFLNIRRRPSPRENKGFLSDPGFVLDWYLTTRNDYMHWIKQAGLCNWLWETTPACTKTSLVRLDVWTAQILSYLFLTPKKWQMQKFWIFSWRHQVTNLLGDHWSEGTNDSTLVFARHFLIVAKVCLSPFNVKGIQV